jgi:hypothetical protein
MKKVKLITTTLMMCFLISVSFGQDTIIATRGGFTAGTILSPSDDVITYNRVIEWVNETYKNPDKVLTGKIEGKSVTIAAHKEYAISWESIGVLNGYGMDYNIYVTITGGNKANVKIVCNKLRNEGLYTDVKYLSSFYKKDGREKTLYVTYIKQLEVVCNDLYLSLYDKIINSVMSSDEALTELKRCKDKLDLGLMSQEDFNKNREELSKLIK